MSKKLVVSVAERLAELKHIPTDKLPSTLRNQIKLNNIQEVRLHYRPMCKNVGASLKFVREFGPSIRFYNPHISINKIKDTEGPIAMTIQVLKKGNQEPITLPANDFKKPQELLNKIREIDLQQ